MDDSGFSITVSAIANWKNGELLDSLNLSICDYCNESGEKVRISRTSIVYDNNYWIAYRNCRNADHLQIIKEVIAANKNTFPQQMDEFTSIDRIRYSPNTGNYVLRFTVSGGFDNDALDYNKIGSAIRKNAMRQQRLLIKKSKEICDFYKLLEKQKVLIKYEYYSASTNKLLFSFSLTPNQLLKH